MKQHKWSTNDDNWLKENYKILGPDECAIKLGLRKSQVENRVFKLNLKLPKELRNSLQSIKPEKCNINPFLFYNIGLKRKYNKFKEIIS